MTLQHTPGPWKLRIGTGIEYDYIIETKTGALVTAYPHYTGATKKVTKANARLMANAPDLLQELINIASAMPSTWDDPSEFKAWAQSRAQAAIAKATGEKQ